MRRVLAVVCVVAAFAAALHACGDERRPVTGSRTPTAEDPAFGYVGNVLIAEESTGPDGGEPLVIGRPATTC